MTTKKRIIWVVAVAIIIMTVFFIGRDIRDYLDFKKAVEAAGSMPWQFGGKINFYQPVCVATPPDGICKNCAMCTTAIGNYVCASYSEIQFTPATGSKPPNFVCPFQGYYYRGGGTMPTIGGQIIGGGTSPAFPWVIGISGTGASRIQKLVDAFNFFIAGKRE